MEVDIEKGLKLEVIFPNHKKMINENELNNNSLVFKLKYNNFSMLFTGDIEEIAENDLIGEITIKVDRKSNLKIMKKIK